MDDQALLVESDTEGYRPVKKKRSAGFRGRRAPGSWGRA
jgi:hypothetical protein